MAQAARSTQLSTEPRHFAQKTAIYGRCACPFGRAETRVPLPLRAMFSYRHAFHAGNHADVLKHTTLIATLQHLTEKEVALAVLDTHAGAGMYRLDGDYANTSGE